MPLINWNDLYATGIAEIDQQHQQLFQAVNDLFEGIQQGHAREQIGKTIDFLVDYARSHFQAEEEFMRSHGFDGLAAHRTEHELLLQEAVLFRAQFLANSASVRPMEVARFLSDWLTHHIQRMDFQYANFVKMRPER